MNNQLPIFEDLFDRSFTSLSRLEEAYLKQSLHQELTVNDFHIIQNIGLYTERTMSELAKMQAITPGALTPAVDRLVKKGFIIRNHNETDRRVILIKLTPRGEAAFREHARFHAQITQKLVEGLTLEEGMALLKALEKLADSIANQAQGSANLSGESTR